MSAGVSPETVIRRGPPRWIKLIVTLVLLFHFSAILCNVIAGGGPYVMQRITAFFRPYLHSMWLMNAYRFFAPNPGPTDVLWYHLHYEDGSARWLQVPRREDFYLRMPFQRYMSIAMLAMMMSRVEEVPAAEDPDAAANQVAQRPPLYREVLSPGGEVYFRSYARFISRKYREHPRTGAAIKSMDVYRVNYSARTPYQVRMNWDMYDPQLLDIRFMANYDAAGLPEERKPKGFTPRNADDLFVELVQTDILPLLEANDGRPPEQRQSIEQILHEYGIPYPLIMPLLRLSPTEQAAFFARPLDRDSLRQRYLQIVEQSHRSIGKLGPESMTTPPKTDSQSVPGKTPDAAPRSVQ